MDVECQCGAVRFQTPAPRPLAVFHCHCRECRRQSSAAFGTSALFPAAGLFPLDPELRGKLSVYIRPGARARTGRDMACYFCTNCGARVMHRYLKRRSGSAGQVDGPAGGSAGGPDAVGCGGGGDLGGSEPEGGHPDSSSGATSNPADSDLDTSAGAAPDTTHTTPDTLREDDFDGMTITIKGGLISGLDFSKAVHIYTEYAVVPIPEGFVQYPGTPPPDSP